MQGDGQAADHIGLRVVDVLLPRLVLADHTRRDLGDAGQIRPCVTGGGADPLQVRLRILGEVEFVHLAEEPLHCFCPKSGWRRPRNDLCP